MIRWMNARKSGGYASMISPRSMHMVWFAGLRGAVAFALANIFPNTHGNK